MSWDDEDFEVPTSNDKVATNWDDDFADDEPVLESWDAEEEEEAPKKKLSAAEAQKKAEMESDLNSAADLFGSMGLNDHPREKAAKKAATKTVLKSKAAAASASSTKVTADTPIDAHPLFQPETKQDYEKLRKALTPVMTKLADQSSLHYASGLAIDLIRDMAKPMTTENIRKAISTLNVVMKEKEKQERQARLAKAGGTATGGAGKKKAKASRPNLGGAFKKDADVVVDEYDDFNDDDFM